MRVRRWLPRRSVPEVPALLGVPQPAGPRVHRAQRVLLLQFRAEPVLQQHASVEILISLPLT